MWIPSKLRLSSWLGMALVLSFSPLQQTHAQDRHRDFHERGEHDFRDYGGPVPGFRDHDFRDHDSYDRRFLDSRYHHDHYYPPLGFVIDVLPPGYQRIYDPRGDLFFADGVWYRLVGPGRYAVVAPAVGTAIPVLPPSYTTVMVGGVPYYFSNNTYYARSSNGYVVTQPPPGSVVELPPGGQPMQPQTPPAVVELPRGQN
jgi:hypothetical protein